jgi:hypothetical protein
MIMVSNMVKTYHIMRRNRSTGPPRLAGFGEDETAAAMA